MTWKPAEVLKLLDGLQDEFRREAKMALSAVETDICHGMALGVEIAQHTLLTKLPTYESDLTPEEPVGD